MSGKPASRAWPLDTLRIVAAWMVDIQHWSIFGARDVLEGTPLSPFLTVGFLGVDTFFFISGLVIARSAVGRSARDFTIARFARLAPSYLLILVVVLAVMAIVSDPRVSWPVAFSSLSFSEYVTGTFDTSTLVIMDAWTLWIEIQFYFVIAVILLLWQARANQTGGPTLRDLRIVAMAWLALICFDQVGAISLPSLFTLGGFASIFIAGALFGTCADRRTLATMSPVLLLATTLMAFTLVDRVSGKAPQVDAWGAALTITVVCVIVALASMAAPPLPSRVAFWVTLFALSTYPLYLMHQELGNRVLIFFQTNLGTSSAVAVLAATLGCLVASLVISWKFEPAAPRVIRRVAAQSPAAKSVPSRSPGAAP